MEAVLIAVTVLAIATAAGFGAAARRARAEEHRRSAARVAALASTLYPTDGPMDTPPSIADRPVAVSGIFNTFAEAAGGAPPLSKRVIFTAAASVIVIVGGMVLRGGPGPEAAAPQQAAPLELISMRHTRQGRTFTVTGLVRNPDTGRPLNRVAALVFAFDRSGDFVASGRAAIELPTLAPGEESPFVVTVPDLAEVGRYRVSFRTDERLLRHVDRRSAAQLVRVQR